MNQLLFRKSIVVTTLLLLLSIVPTLVFGTNKAIAAESYKGVALKSSTNIYDSTAGRNVLKSYSQGSVLKYKSYNTQWYSAVVVVKGQKKNGYIRKSDVETATTNQASVKGIALQSPTRIYSKASTSSGTLKSYQKGSILKYRTFTNNWYEATVVVKGKRKTGYIHRSHIENAVGKQENLRGIGLKSPTKIFKKATSGAAWKSYAQGTVLKYKTFSPNWYEATVYVKGKKRTGYIPKSHVENTTSAQKNGQGIGLKQPTYIYAQASTSSKRLKSYAAGSILKYKTFSKNWNEVTIYIKGKRTTGYLHKSHIESLLSGKAQTKDGAAIANPTRVYSKASKSSSTLKTYKKGSILKFQTFSPNWYKATVQVKGKKQTGYIYHKDVNLEKVFFSTTSYHSTFTHVVNTQLANGPQVSAKPGGWMNASKKQVEYYINSSNFSKNSSQYYQFLDLSMVAGLKASEVNSKILNNKGVLTKKAKQFIDAAKKNGINEAYLISHALLETGNGSSELAKGVPVDKNGKKVAEKKKYKTVYNVYGIGATDDCPVDCGAKKALQEKWFSVDEAIAGGAKFIGDGYINNGQNTLYKMRWNPASPGAHQYATDIAWAYKQTNNISKIYNLLDNYVLYYDVPKYAGQPKSSGDPNSYLPIEIYPSGIYGITNTSGTLKLRQHPNTNAKVLMDIPAKSKMTVYKKEGSWYQVKYKDKTGWVHSDYVDLLNLLEAKTEIKVRDGAGTSNKEIGNVTKGSLLVAKLDSKNKLRTKSAGGHIWYEITYNKKTAWVSGGKKGTEYIKIKVK